jgi:hypothetical protein
MTATLTHSHATTQIGASVASRELTVRKSPRSKPSWFSKLIAFLSLPSEIFAEARAELHKAHERFPFVE